MMWRTRTLTKPIIQGLTKRTTRIRTLPHVGMLRANHHYYLSPTRALHIVGRHSLVTTAAPSLLSHQRQQQQQQQTVRWFESEGAYHQVADDTLEGILDAVEQALEAVVVDDDNQDMDISLASGVLTIALPPHGTWVLNKQTPNQQIWWSSPLSGPKRFEFTDQGNMWFCTHSGLNLVPLLAQELSHVLKTEITLDVEL